MTAIEGSDTLPSAPDLIEEGMEYKLDAQARRTTFLNKAGVNHISHIGFFHCLYMEIVCVISDLFLRIVGMTIYTYAASRKDSTSLLQYLIQHRPVSELKNHDRNGNFPLFKAILSGNDVAISLLLQDNLDINVNDGNAQKTTPLMVAASLGNLAVVEVLLDKAARVDDTDNSSATALIWAAHYGSPDVVALLLQSGASANVLTARGNTALMWAAVAGNRETVQLLIQNQVDLVDLNIQNEDGDTALMWAAKAGHTEIAQMLIDNGAKLNQDNSKKETALTLAAKAGHKEIAERLLQNKAEVNAQDHHGKTPLIWAVENQNIDMVNLLLKHEADVTKKNIWGQTALFFPAANRGGQYNDEIMRLLLDHGAQAVVDVKDKDGLTALMVAASWGTLSVAQILTQEAQANVNLQDSKGWTAYDYAIDNGYEITAHLVGNYRID